MNSVMLEMAVFGIVLLMAAHAIHQSHFRRWLAISPLNAFWAGVIVCYVIQPLIYGNVFSDWHGRAVVERSLWWILVSLACVVAGYESRIGAALGARLPRLPERLSGNRMFIAACTLIAVGLAGYAYVIASAGGLRQWLSVARGGTDWGSVSSYVAGLINLVPLGVGLFLFRVELGHGKPLERYAMWGAACLVLLWFAYLGSRSRIIEFGIVMLGAFYLPRHRNPPGWLLAAAFVALFILSGFLGAYRENFTNLSFNLDQVSWEEAGAEVLPGRIEDARSREGRGVSRGIEFNCVATIVKLVPDRVPYNRGYSLLEFLTRPIPRAIWPDKRYPALEAAYPILKQGRLSTTLVKTSKRPLLMGPSFTFAGHWYAAGGPALLMVAGFLTGCMLKMIAAIYERLPRHEGDTILFAHLVMIGFKEAAATPLVWVFGLNSQVIPLVIALVLCRAGEERT
ncbi:MAG: hypothetical protein FJ224_00010 [Lentisphaerae bacterium]|nr:hypothetical protein [Lentisphaerota bacterium]